MQITASITNVSDHYCQNDTGWVVSIRFPDGSVHDVASVGGGAELPGADFPPGETQPGTASWNVASSDPGAYVVIWDWWSGVPHAIGQAQFTVT